MHGKGKMEWPSGSVYIGGYDNGLKHGLGLLRWPDGSYYCGNWEKGRKHGTGVVDMPTARSVSIGIWHQDELLSSEPRSPDRETRFVILKFKLEKLYDSDDEGSPAYRSRPVSYRGLANRDDGSIKRHSTLQQGTSFPHLTAELNRSCDLTCQSVIAVRDSHSATVSGQLILCLERRRWICGVSFSYILTTCLWWPCDFASLDFVV